MGIVAQYKAPTGPSIWLTPWKLVCWRARVLLAVLFVGGVLDALRLFR